MRAVCDYYNMHSLYMVLNTICSLKIAEMFSPYIWFTQYIPWEMLPLVIM